VPRHFRGGARPLPGGYISVHMVAGQLCLPLLGRISRQSSNRYRDVERMRNQMSISDSSGGSRSRPIQPARMTSTRVIVRGRTEEDADWLVSGFDPGTGGSPPPPTPPSRPDFGPDPGIVNPAVPPTVPPSGERPCPRWVIWEAWFTMHDERVCPECGPLHGRQFQRGIGPQPPLHSGCRCFRREVRRECESRRAGGAGAGTNY
jgi:hypothetical protein